MYAFIRRQPIGTIFALFGGLVILAGVNHLLTKAGVYNYSSCCFPISVFNGPTLHIFGLSYLFFFLIILFFAIKWSSLLNVYQIWAIGLILILLGNLGQSNWDSAILKPFYVTGIQYYDDAIKITSWSEWLALFNANQSELFVHSRTHPPFAVLIHYFPLRASGNNISILGLVFLILSSLSILIVWYIFKALEVPASKRNRLTLLFSVLPAVNIYSGVSLDGLILSTSTLFLLGLVLLAKEDRITMAGILFLFLGFTMTNLLTYGGVFLLSVAVLVGLKELIFYKNSHAIIATGATLLVFLIFNYVMDVLFNYNHFQGFITASALENPDGFRGFTEPIVYLVTRIENVSEIALFFSFGCLAVLLHSDRLKVSLLDWRRLNIGIMISGVITLMVMFVAGAFRTGETARACLFIYPYLMLAFVSTDSITMKDLIVLAGLQTVGMQLLGEYHW